MRFPILVLLCLMTAHLTLSECDREYDNLVDCFIKEGIVTETEIYDCLDCIDGNTYGDSCADIEEGLLSSIEECSSCGSCFPEIIEDMNCLNADYCDPIDTSSGLSAGAIAGIVVAVLVVVALASVIIYVAVKRRKISHNHSEKAAVSVGTTSPAVEAQLSSPIQVVATPIQVVTSPKGTAKMKNKKKSSNDDITIMSMGSTETKRISTLPNGSTKTEIETVRPDGSRVITTTIEEPNEEGFSDVDISDESSV